MRIIRTSSTNTDFVLLTKQLDADIQIRDGDEHPFFAQFNKPEDIKYALIAYINKQPVGCGAIKHYMPGTMEIKRMFVPPEWRGNGIATKVLAELEEWAKEMGFLKCILETGRKQPEALALYGKNGYQVIPNFAQYKNVTSSVCFEKIILAEKHPL